MFCGILLLYLQFCVLCLPLHNLYPRTKATVNTKMAMEKRKLGEIPPDAIILSEDEALKYQANLLNKWKKSSDVFAYKYGAIILGGATMLAGMYMNNYFRIKYKLLHYGRIASYLPVCAIPASLSFLFHHQFVVRDLLLLKQDQCPICIEMRASVLQSAVGCLMPLILAPVASIGLVHKYGTFNMPYITKHPSQVYNLLKKQIKPIQNVLFGIFIGQALLASAMTYLEANSVYRVNFKLLQLEKELELTHEQ